jgi:outer membrane protein TolC
MKYPVLTLFILIFSSLAKAQAATVSLNDYLKIVESQNLTIAASLASSEAADSRAVGVKLPEPMVGLSQMKDSSGSANGFEISQTIPFPTKLTSDHDARKFEAQMEKANTRGLKNEVLAKARLLYISTWAAQEKATLLKEKYDVIKKHLKLSQASTRSDSSLSIHALKAESDMDMVENEILEAKQVFAEQQISLAEYAKQDPHSYRPNIEAPPVSSIPTADSLANPNQLEAKRLNVEMFAARSSQAKSEWLPDLNFKYREFGGGTTMMDRNKEVMVSATLPFAYFWEPNAASKSAQAEKLKAKVMYDDEKLSITAKAAALTARAGSLKQQLELINQKLIPRAEKRMKLIRNLAPRDMESLQEHREGMEVFPDLKIKALDLRLQYETTIAALMTYVSDKSAEVKK